MAVHQGRTALYRCYADHNVVIYVGITSNPHRRWTAHASASHWWGEVTVREIEWFATRDEAEAQEALAIERTRPRENRAPGTLGEEVARAPRRGTWHQPAGFTARVTAYREAEEALALARSLLEEEILSEMHAGVSATKIAPYTPWTYESLRTLGREHHVARLREPRVRSIREPKAEATS